MGTNENPETQAGLWSQRILAMKGDLQFLRFLLRAPVYSGQRPNLYERLNQYRLEAGSLQEALDVLQPDQHGALLAFEARLNAWKAGVYEFLESAI